MPIALAAIIPPITVVPMTWRAIEPAPDAIHTATHPKMNPNKPIKIRTPPSSPPSTPPSLPGLWLLIRHSPIVEAHLMRHGLFEGFFQSGRGLIRAIAGGGAPVDLRRAVFVIAHGEFRAFARCEGRQCRQRNHVALAVADEKLAKIVRIRPVIGLGLDIDLPLTAEIVEVVDEQAAHVCLDGPVDVA